MQKQRFQCGTCLYHSREKIFEEKCSAQGKIPTAKSCSSFQPDSYQLVEHDPLHSDLEMVANVMHKMTPHQLILLSALVNKDRFTRKHGYYFYQEVYFRYCGSPGQNYLSNFVRARVLDADKDFVRLVGDNEKHRMYLVVENKKNASLYTPKEFRVLRAEMLREHKLVDPALNFQLTAKSKSGVVADIDDAFEQDKLDKKAVRMRAKHRDDLVTLIARMDRGMYGSPTRQAPVYGETIDIKHD